MGKSKGGPRGARAAKATPPRSRPKRRRRCRSARRRSRRCARRRRASARRRAALAARDAERGGRRRRAWSPTGWLAGPGPGRRARRGRGGAGAPGQEPAERGEQPRPARDCGAGDGGWFGAVLKDDAVSARIPLGAVLGHLRATLPAPPAGGASAGRRKKGSKCSV